MSLIKFLKGVRNHWKKSTFAVGAISYGISYANKKYEINEIMRTYCAEAVKYGDVKQDITIPPKRIVVILNPAANKKSAEKTFKKYCEPILHLSGMIIDVIKTDSEGHARRYVENMEKLPDAIIVAGGDGTLSETITGLMRRTGQYETKCPIGVLPLGRTNSVAQKVHKLQMKPNNIEEVKDLAESTMSILRGKTQKKDVIKIQIISTDVTNSSDDQSEITDKKPTEEPKPIFAMSSLQWGAFRDIQSLRDKYWYVGPFREYASVLFNAFNDKLTWNCKAKLIYTPPCSGCKNCYIPQQLIRQNQLSTGRWWSRFIPKFHRHQTQNFITPQIDYSTVINENCSQLNSIELNSTEIILSANNNNNNDVSSDSKNENIPKLEVCTEGPFKSSYEFITEIWNRIKTNEIKSEKKIEARTIELIPEIISADDNEIFYSIDSEAYEVRPIKVVLIPKAVELFAL